MMLSLKYQNLSGKDGKSFSQDDDDVDKPLPPTNKTFLIKMESADNTYYCQ